VRQGESVLQRRISLGELLDGESFTEVVKGFVELYKVGIKVFDDKGGKLADIKVGNGDFCGYVFSFRKRLVTRLEKFDQQLRGSIEGRKHTLLPNPELISDTPPAETLTEYRYASPTRLHTYQMLQIF
jgi:hypothetical protein